RKWMATAHRAGPSTWAAATTWSASKLSATLSRMRRADTSSVKRRATTLDGDEACRRASNEAISHWSQGVIHKLVYLIHKLRRPRSTDFLTHCSQGRAPVVHRLPSIGANRPARYRPLFPHRSSVSWTCA